MVVRKPAKKQRSEDAREEARALAVVMEEQRGHFKVFGEALQGMRDEMGVRFDAVDQRLDAVDQRLDAVDQRLDGLDTDLSLVKVAVLETNRGIMELRRSVEELDARKVDRDELRPPAG